LFHRLGVDAKIGFGEAYMVGDWTTGAGTDLANLLTPFAARISRLVPPLLQRLRSLVERPQPIEELNSEHGAPENISRHYDLSNGLFESFLDESMTYSSAWFEPGDDLNTAQLRKIDGVLDHARVTAGMHVLEIGTGWGALAIRAAQRGARVTTLTLSAEQQQLAERRIKEVGLETLVEVRRQDYREVTGSFDAVVSVEMIEAVGAEFWPAYFSTIERVLVPGGRMALQAITMPHDRMLATRRSYTWIHKYIFPGGLIPSIEAIEGTLAKHTTLSIVERRDLGPHYEETLRRWRDRFEANWDDIAALGFDGTFRRMWEFWLAYCEAGFRVGYLGVSQLALARNPFTR
ncbi:MAG: cyclopropane-fatty-acyl-phospholipid synthase family protein, partial [Actinomycetota bacterium]|nr:cyclopropane-fatty-acyl-phospholipid synthase family protein [Actinomycetota bacterium]